RERRSAVSAKMRIPWCSSSRVEAAQVGVSRLARQRLGEPSGRHQQLVEEHAVARTLQDRAGMLLGCRAPTAGQLRGYRGGAIEERGGCCAYIGHCRPPSDLMEG